MATAAAAAASWSTNVLERIIQLTGILFTKTKKRGKKEQKWTTRTAKKTQMMIMGRLEKNYFIDRRTEEEEPEALSIYSTVRTNLMFLDGGGKGAFSLNSLVAAAADSSYAHSSLFFCCCLTD